MSQVNRPIIRTVRGQPASDGAGVKMLRIIGTQTFPDLDPFLMLDEFGSDDPDAYIGGFPDHPHRGFETVTYMLEGRMRHNDSKGNSGDLGPGSVQWMTAGSGLIHSEMPLQEHGMMRGFQLWVNLPARDKMTPPRYQDIAPEAVPVVTRPGLTMKILTGTSAEGVSGPVAGIATEPLYFDAHLDAHAQLVEPLPRGHSAFVYCYEGQIRVGPTSLRHGELGVLGAGDRMVGEAGEQGARVLLVAGRPLHEPIERHGPFVMNTREEIRQAFADFHAGRF